MNKSSRLQENNERKNTLVVQSVVWFSDAWIKDFRLESFFTVNNFSDELPLFQKLRYSSKLSIHQNVLYLLFTK